MISNESQTITGFVFEMPGPHDIHPLISRKAADLLLKHLHIPKEISERVSYFLFANFDYCADIINKWEPTDYDTHHLASLMNYRCSEVEIGKFHGNPQGFFCSDCPLCKKETDKNSRWLGTSVYPLSNMCSKGFESMASPDLLYCARCMFPNLQVDSNGPESYKSIFAAAIQHKETGFILGFSESKGSISLRIGFGKYADQFGILSYGWNRERDEKVALFTKAVLDLLNCFIPREEHRFYHPAAFAWSKDTTKAYYSGFPKYDIGRDGDSEKAKVFQNKWKSRETDLKLDSVVAIANASNFTQVASAVFTRISSSLLFYRLLCLWKFPDTPAVLNSAGKVTGVWSVSLQFCGRESVTDEKADITFCDYHGLSKVKISKRITDDDDLQKEFCDLLDFLASDVYPHPYDGLVAGSVA
ncbi:hypothetical protein HK098_006604 [Nowakowskiella sp. JEL0407]|nr:hypothetical protein HK098_006604 [Nowakowskiella sp. JEL0407]